MENTSCWIDEHVQTCNKGVGAGLNLGSRDNTIVFKQPGNDPPTSSKHFRPWTWAGGESIVHKSSKLTYWIHAGIDCYANVVASHFSIGVRLIVVVEANSV